MSVRSSKSCGPSLLRGLGQRVGITYVGVTYVGVTYVGIVWSNSSVSPKFIGVTEARTSMSERFLVFLSASRQPILVNAIDQTLAVERISRRSMMTRTCRDNPTASPCETMNEGATGHPPAGSSGIFLTHVHCRQRLTTTAIIRTKNRLTIQAPARSSTNIAADRVGFHHRGQRPELMITPISVAPALGPRPRHLRAQPGPTS